MLLEIHKELCIEIIEWLDYFSLSALSLVNQKAYSLVKEVITVKNNLPFNLLTKRDMALSLLWRYHDKIFDCVTQYYTLEGCISQMESDRRIGRRQEWFLKTTNGLGLISLIVTQYSEFIMRNNFPHYYEILVIRLNDTHTLKFRVPRKVNVSKRSQFISSRFRQVLYTLNDYRFLTLSQKAFLSEYYP